MAISSGDVDECVILQIYDNGWCKVRYPVKELYKIGYCELSAFIDPNMAVARYSAKVAADTNVYRKSSLQNKFGSVWVDDLFTVVAKNGNATQIIYPLDDGGYKMGWIESSAIKDEYIIGDD